MKKTGLAKIEQPEFVELIQNSGLELTKAETYALGYAPLMMKVREQTDIIKGLDKNVPEHSVIAKKASVQLGHICSELEDKKEEDKKYIRIEDKLIQGLFNVAESTARLGQKDAKEIFTYQEKLQKEAEEKLCAERIELLAPYETDTEFLSLDKMPEDQFQKLLAKEKESFELVTAKRAKDEADRIAKEKADEEKRIADELAEKERQIERDKELAELKAKRQADEKSEINRIAKEKANPDKLVKILLKNGYSLLKHDTEPEYDTYVKDEYSILYHELFTYSEEYLLKLIATHNTKIEEAKEKQAELDRVKADNDRIAKELDAKKEQEEREKQQTIAEQNERDAQAKAALLAPDKDKVKAFYNQFIALQFPELESEQGKAMAVRVNEALAIVKQVIIQDSKTLL